MDLRGTIGAPRASSVRWSWPKPLQPLIKASSVGAWNAIGGGAASIERAAANVRTVIAAGAVEVKTAAA